MGAWNRFWATACAVGLIGVLGVAAWLHPDPAGHGTHQQLNLPPCTAVYLFGIRCPACGMTTAWSNVMHGRIVPALQANATGAGMCISAIAGSIWLLASACLGRWIFARPASTIAAGLSVLLVICMFTEWALRVFLL